MKFLFKLANSIFKRIQKIRVISYHILSNHKNIKGNPLKNQPLLFLGEGVIEFGENVTIGYFPSPMFWNTYAHIEARKKESILKVGSSTIINNNFCMISESTGIEIGNNVLIGSNVHIYDSDFHNLNPEKRLNGIPNTAPVHIEDNVFIGSNVTILKGVNIGKNAVIASGSIVTKDIPSNVIAGGIPAKVIRELEINKE